MQIGQTSLGPCLDKTSNLGIQAEGRFPTQVSKGPCDAPPTKADGRPFLSDRSGSRVRSSSTNFSVGVTGKTTSELQDKTQLVASEQPVPPLLELFCVTAQFIGALGMDHVLNKARVKGPATKIDLSCEASQRLVLKEIRDGRVDVCLLARPYGTSFWALRTADCPKGVPRLSGLDRLRVRQANKLYAFCQKVFQACARHKVLCIVEGPRTAKK